MFDTVLVANRGEIAVRIMRTLRALGMRSVAVHSDADAAAPHVRQADVSVRLGPAPAARSYLRIERIVEGARRTGAQAVHPGYGFLAENAAFARACAQAGLIFVGPPPEAIEVMGDKIRAKAAVEPAGVPVVPGVHRPDMSDEQLLAAARGVGYPLMVKAAAGGGGKGMRVVADPDGLPAALAAARREAAGAFDDDALLLERYVTRPRHIEVQVFADAHGEVVHLGERECSLQRRHQKVVEECPSPLLDDETRRRMGAAAVATAAACGYVGAGTVEFLVSADAPDEFFFLEMNTRLQVEHAVTEEVYGVDLVEWQLRVAAGEPLPPGPYTPAGHAVEARVYAEDPAGGFLPTGGTVVHLHTGDTRLGVRVDAGVGVGTVVGSDYDPLLAKVIAHAPDREGALRRLRAGLADLELLGVVTNVGFLRALLDDPDVRAGRLDTGLIERRLGDLVATDVPDDVYVAAALAHVGALEPPPGTALDPFDLPGGWRVGEHAWTTLRLLAGHEDPVDVHVRGHASDARVRIGQGAPRHAAAELDPAAGCLTMTLDATVRRFAVAHAAGVVWVGAGGRAWALRELDELTAARHGDQAQAVGPLVAPLPGTVTVVNVTEGQVVRAGQTLLVLEAMKMEHPVTAPVDGTVATVAVRAGERVGMEQLLAVVEPGGP